MMRADTKDRPNNNSLTLALFWGGEGSRGLISPASPMEKRLDMLEKKYALIG